MAGWMDTLNAFGQWLVPTMWRLSIEMAILAAVVAAAVFALRVNSPSLRHLFWGLVLAKPVATLFVASPVSLYWFLHSPEPSLSPAVAPAAQVRTMTRPPAAAWPRDRWAILAATDPHVVPHGWQRLDAYGLAAGIWTLGVLALGIRRVVGLAYVRALRRAATLQTHGQLADAARGAATVLGMRRPPGVALAAAAPGPILAGILRPVVLLPPQMVSELSTDQVRLIVAHELAHARRCDNLVLLMQRAAETLLFFHPAVWLCGRAMRRAAEAACDDAVLRACGEPGFDALPAVYADSLTRVAEMHGALAGRRLLNMCVMAESHFAVRVRRILWGRTDGRTFGLSLAAVASLVIIALVGLPTAAARQARPNQEKEGSRTMGEQPTAPTRVMRAGGKVWIEGVEKLRWGQNSDLTYAEALAALCRAIGRKDVTAHYVAGVSGLAFRVQVEKTPLKWLGEVPAAEVGWDCTRTPLEALGFDVAWLGPHVDRPEEEPLRAAVMESIDRGLPVVSSGPVNTPDWGLIVGYADGGQRLLLRSFFDQGEDYGQSTDLPTIVMPITAMKEPPARRESVLKSLRIAVQMAHGPGPSQYHRVGFAALEDWIADLRDEGRFAAVVAAHEEFDPDDPLRSASFSNGLLYGNLAAARKLAGRYLAEVENEFDGPAAEGLAEAAVIYGRAADKLADGLEIVPGPGAVEQGRRLTEELRTAEADLLQEVLALERRAIAQIERALAAERVVVPR